MDRWTDGPMDRWTDGPMDRWTDLRCTILGRGALYSMDRESIGSSQIKGAHKKSARNTFVYSSYSKEIHNRVADYCFNPFDALAVAMTSTVFTS